MGVQHQDGNNDLNRSINQSQELKVYQGRHQQASKQQQKKKNKQHHQTIFALTNASIASNATLYPRPHAAKTHTLRAPDHIQNASMLSYRDTKPSLPPHKPPSRTSPIASFSTYSQQLHSSCPQLNSLRPSAPNPQALIPTVLGLGRKGRPVAVVVVVL